MQTKRLTVIVGAYGSGKTEVALNYALLLVRGRGNVALVDLDIVNPFFRSRDLRDLLEEQGINVVSSQAGFESADLPALSPQIFSILQDKSIRGVFDVGGDPAGARALGRFCRFFSAEPYDMWMVVNPFRPDTRDADQICGMLENLETASRLKVTGLIDNTNLGIETSLDDLENGRKLLSQVAKRLELPIVYRTRSQDCPPEAEEDGIPVLDLNLYVRPQWLAER